MNRLLIKIIFLCITVFILFFCISYAKYEIKEKSNIFAGIFVLLFTIISVISSNIVFWQN